MTKRKVLIIEKASELFAENGFEATSVQDITDACGISKGAFYLSFKSKEALLFAIFEYFSGKLIKRMSGVNDLSVNPRERFKLFFSIQFEEIAHYSDFILMQMREQTNLGNEEMIGIMNEIRRKTYEMQESLLLGVYGEKVKAHMPDLLVLLGGLTNGYIEIIVFNKDALKYEQLAEFLMDRVDSIVNGLSKPFLTAEQLLGNHALRCNSPTDIHVLLAEISSLKNKITHEDYLISLEILEQELSRDEYRKPVITGMMSNLRESAPCEGLLKKIELFLSHQN